MSLFLILFLPVSSDFSLVCPGLLYALLFAPQAVAIGSVSKGGVIMFSDAQQRYIASLVASMRGEYPYYIAYSDFRNSDYDSPQLYIVFCKEKITSKGLYSYVVPAGVRYAVNTYNYSSYNSSSARTVVTAYSGGTLNIPVYEWIYTNSEFSSYSVQPDVNSLYGGDYNAQIQVQNFVVITALLAFLFASIATSFRRRF